MNIDTTALTDLENFYRQWREDTSTFLDGLVTPTMCKIVIDNNSIPNLDKLENFPGLPGLLYPSETHSDIEKEIENNLLVFGRDGLEYAYLQRLDSLYGSIESSSNEYTEKFNYVNERVRLCPLGQRCSFVLGTIHLSLKLIQQGFALATSNSLFVSEQPEKFPFLGPFVRMCHQFKTQFAKDPSKAIFQYEQDVNRNWIEVGKEPQSTTPAPQPTEPETDEGLSAVQKLLFIRLLQEQGLFPKKPANTDDAPELRAIALLTGLSYEKQIKGGTGATTKVNQLLNNLRSITRQQVEYKLNDLAKVEQMATSLNVDSVIGRIGQIRKDLNQIITG